MNKNEVLTRIVVTVIMSLFVMVPVSLALQGYWKGDAGTPKEGYLGAYDTVNGLPPDTTATTREAYQNYTANDTSQKPPTLAQRAKMGDVDAINTIIDSKGGWSNLTATQKEKVTQLLLHRDVTL